MIPENVWVIFTTPNKEPTPGASGRDYISGNPRDIQNILQMMHDGNYNNLNNNNTFNEQFRIYPGGITQDLNFNPKLIYSTGRWTFSGIMKSENYLKEFNRAELKNFMEFLQLSHLEIYQKEKN